MGLFTRNMKPCIFHNGNECILNHIMGNNPFPTMGTIKKVGFCRIDKGCTITDHVLFHFTFHLFFSGMWEWNKSCRPQMECFQWNVPQISNNLLILQILNKNCKLVRCNHRKVECAKCHKSFGQISLVDLVPPIFS
jgi:hypothetical protein